MIVSFAVFTTALFGSCTSKEGSGEEPESPTISYKVRVKVSTGEYTRAGDDAAVNTLHLAFFTGATLNGVVKAEKETDGTFQCDLPEGTKPNGVIAFANLSDTQAQAITEDNIMTLNYSDLENSDGTMIMSSARYFDEAGKDMLKTPLSIINLIDDGDPLAIALDRLASKVSVNKTADTKLGEVNIDRGNGRGSAILALNVISWGVSGVEKASNLIKSFGSSNTFSLLSDELAGWSNWNYATGKVSHWAHSVTYDVSNQEYPNDVSLTKTYNLTYPTIDRMITKLNNYVYCHETTRPQEDYANPNALASLVIVGQYKTENLSDNTFYRYLDNLFFEDMLIDLMLDKQTFLYAGDRSLITSKSTNAKVNFELSRPANTNDLPYNFVTLQIKSGQNIAGLLYDDKGNYYTDREKINKALAEECGFAEVFKDGKCYFIVPIRNNSVAKAEEVTGSYGLVRNHHYNITISSISGIGTGIASNNDVPLKYTYPGQTESQYKVNANVSVNEWQNVNQTVDIPKN